jgi:predicted peroxiredoxin
MVTAQNRFWWRALCANPHSVRIVTTPRLRALADCDRSSGYPGRRGSAWTFVHRLRLHLNVGYANNGSRGGAVDMADKLVMVVTAGLDDERASVAWSIANGGIASDLEVTVFLTSSGVDWARKGAADSAHLNPLDPPMKELIDNFMGNGGDVLVCPPCAGVRGYSAEDLLDGVTIVGSPAIHALIKDGAATLSF